MAINSSIPGGTQGYVTPTGQEKLENKEYSGGTASATNRFVLSRDTKSNLDSLARQEGAIYYATDEDKIYTDDGTALQSIGGGLIPIEEDKDITGDLEVGRHYLIDLDGATADVTLNLPAGEAESVIRISVFGQGPTGWECVLTPDGTEKLYYDETSYDILNLGSVSPWAQLSWDAGRGWIVDDPSNVPLQGELTYVTQTTTIGFTNIATGTVTVGVTYTKIGNVVTMTLDEDPNGSAANTSNPQAAVGSIPEAFRPNTTEATMYFTVLIQNNSAVESGFVGIRNNGSMEYYRPAFAAWTASGTKGVYATAFSWTV